MNALVGSFIGHITGASLRAGPNPAVVESQVLEEVDPLKFIEAAITHGDQLRTDSQARGQLPYVERRALIIAPQYPAHFHEWKPLKHTIKDVILIYKMLLENGYAKENIRILVDGLEDIQGVQPTRDNILLSLDWLVSDARSADYRYLHFSGHGVLFDSVEGEGKQTFEVPNNNERCKTGDLELDPTSNNRMQYARVNTILDPSNKKIKYYKEAIVASYNIVPIRGNKLEYHVVFDTELNTKISRLPEGCRLTCTLDCCHSGRMVGCNFKLDGAGFRGRRYFSFDEDGRAGKDSLGEAQAQEITEEMRSLNVENPQGTIFPPLEKSLLARGGVSLAVSAGGPAPVIAMTDSLPPEEIQMDQIKADMLVWSACHQRQLALDYIGGLFTKEFTSLVAGSKDSKKTVGQFHEELSSAVRKAVDGHKEKHSLQYAQVWTSLGRDDENQARAKLKHNFVI